MYMLVLADIPRVSTEERLFFQPPGLQQPCTCVAGPIVECCYRNTAYGDHLSSNQSSKTVSKWRAGGSGSRDATLSVGHGSKKELRQPLQLGSGTLQK